jgi:hypothetical protein
MGNIFTKKYFFGWSNIKWVIKEFGAMYSNTESYFSKKRFESSMAFLGAMSLILWHAYYSRATITNSEILADAALLFGIAGYTVNQIQKEKKESPLGGSAPKEPANPEQAKKMILENQGSKKEDFSKDEESI